MRGRNMSATVEEPRGSIDVALNHAARLLVFDPVLAEEQATEILKIAPDNARAQLALGLALAGQGRHENAIAALRRASELDPQSSEAWRALGDELTLLEDGPGADLAYAQSIRASVHDPRLMEAARAL